MKIDLYSIVNLIIQVSIFFLIYRIKKKFDSKYQNEIELIRNQFKFIFDAINNNQSMLQTRRIESVQKLWNTILIMKNFFSPVIVFFDVFSPKEYQKALHESNFSQYFHGEIANFYVEMPKEIEEIENLRPFLGDKLWFYFYAYRAILGRLVFHAFELKSNINNTNHWLNDSLIQEYIKFLLSSDEIEILNSKNRDLINVRYLINLIEEKILYEINLIIEGKKTLEESFQSSKELYELFQKDNVFSKKLFI